MIRIAFAAREKFQGNVDSIAVSSDLFDHQNYKVVNYVSR